jgi:hypothetical protein
MGPVPLLTYCLVRGEECCPAIEIKYGCACWFMPVILTLRQRQEGHKFEAILGYIARL